MNSDLSIGKEKMGIVNDESFELFRTNDGNESAGNSPFKEYAIRGKEKLVPLRQFMYDSRCRSTEGGVCGIGRR